MWPNNSHQASGGYPYNHSMPATSGSYGGSPPPLSDLNSWFDYYDRDRSGFLTKDEVTKALIETFGIKSVPSFVVKQAVSKVWKNFDRNKDGRIDRYEFTKVGGVGSKLLSMLSQQQGTSQNLHSSMPPQQQPYAPMATQHHQSQFHSSMPPQQQPYAPMAAQNHQQFGMSNSMPPQYAAPTYNSAPQNLPMATAIPVQQPQYQTMRASIPPGMSAGQSLNINTPSGMFTVVIPNQSQWTITHLGQPTFECRIPSSAPVVQAQVVHSQGW
mmetsp:Transcript_19966/g.28405  ORF Transcript_19966/g.28405 Transcript_19966/m.28405 type:complete len:270 (+) Transcript_19966:121-930(+)